MKNNKNKKLKETWKKLNENDISIYKKYIYSKMYLYNNGYLLICDFNYF